MVARATEVGGGCDGYAIREEGTGREGVSALLTDGTLAKIPFAVVAGAGAGTGAGTGAGAGTEAGVMAVLVIMLSVEAAVKGE